MLLLLKLLQSKIKQTSYLEEKLAVDYVFFLRKKIQSVHLFTLIANKPHCISQAF